VISLHSATCKPALVPSMPLIGYQGIPSQETKRPMCKVYTSVSSAEVKSERNFTYTLPAYAQGQII
jgi:hypothetical protein